MPHRLITLGIVLFWLGMTGLLVWREVVPMLRADGSPSVQVDLTDEIGSRLVGWTVSRDGKRIGSGTSRITPLDDRCFEFRSSFHYDQFTILAAQIKSLESTYRVNEEGKLLSLSTRASVSTEGFNFNAGIEGDVVDGFIKPHLFAGTFKKTLNPIEVRQQGSVINPMHLVSRLRGVREGMTWKVNLIDPLGGVKEQFLPKQAVGVPQLIAEVKVDTLQWNRKPVECYKIEYSEPDKEVSARTWVRKRDGLVLQQDASFMGTDMVLQRIPD